MLHLANFISESINEGEGLRAVFFFSGCPFRCRACHNPEMRNECYGEPFDDDLQEKFLKKIEDNILLDGITLCGGDPFYDPKEVLKFVRKYKERFPSHTIWSYSGYTWERLLWDEDRKALAQELDVLIDGPFVLRQKDLTLKFRGSSNQRVIDVKPSLEKNEAVIRSGYENQ
ncbi:anaerobic ribonucleoside-triphosphate reductase activating protein [Sediminitomix flava]|uniref:Anaerobic ribonucleoside-triphosphate reductase-activating protein n=1 Tax=Sediminitomix flava TaxID=379075 RepID=A0A315ZC49_SEDFL|nr:anaerobic ribonucleoside-triphosphate reductase activating protein [Sediminitomix flava]PWJ42314.1 anaerobic ribonucleoside-triphosphate reductase activating protein [Sediminitomix flava]